MLDQSIDDPWFLFVKGWTLACYRGASVRLRQAVPLCAVTYAHVSIALFMGVLYPMIAACHGLGWPLPWRMLKNPSMVQTEIGFMRGCMGFALI